MLTLMSGMVIATGAADAQGHGNDMDMVLAVIQVFYLVVTIGIILRT